MIEDDLISKKDLLSLAGISYGQLYRWKRKNLIPEEWFVRKSTFTGQETFFPRDRMLARIDKIKNMKDGLSLDDLAEVFSPMPAEIRHTADELPAMGIVSAEVVSRFKSMPEFEGVLDFERIFYLFLVEKMLAGGNISLDEGRMILAAMVEHFPKYTGRAVELYFLRKLGISTCMLAPVNAGISIESGAKLLTVINLTNYIEELKIKLGR